MHLQHARGPHLQISANFDESDSFTLRMTRSSIMSQKLYMADITLRITGGRA